MSEIKNLPKGWEVKKLGEVCEIVSGNTPKGLEHISNKGEFHFYKVSDMNLIGNETIMTVSNFKLNSIEIKNLKIKTYPKGTVIFPKRGGAILTNKKRILNQDSSFDLNIMGVLPNEKVLSKFLFFWFQKLDLSKIYDGSNVPQINNKNIAPLNFPLPPLPEQLAIVAKIEALFSELDNGIQQLRTAQAQLKVYRQSLLKWAFEGKLTNKEVREGSLPEGWNVYELKNIVKKISDGPFGTNLKSSDYVNEGIRVIRLENIGVMEFRDEYKTYITSEKYESLKVHSVSKGDIIFSSFISDSIRSVILPDFIEKSINKADCFLVRVEESKINKKYLAYYFSTKALYNQLVNQIHGATRPRINTTQLKTSLIPFAPLEEQQLIVAELESKLTVCDKIEETINQSLQQAETLRQSILKQAFEGKLINMK